MSGSAPMSAIEINGLYKRFDTAARVLDSVGFTATGGTLTLISGAPGSGRTTLVRCITGVYRSSGGQVTFRLDGRGAVRLSDAHARTVAWMRSHHIGTFHGPLAGPPRLSAAAAVARAARRDLPSAVGALTRIGVSELATVPIGRLGTVDRHTVALAATLLAERAFVVLDEPEKYVQTTGLTDWLHEVTDAGAAVVATGAPGSRLGSIATSVGDLRRGRLEWQRP